MMETIKQTAFQNIQGDLGGHMDTLSVKDGAGKAQQALTLHKVDMEASVMEVSSRLGPNVGILRSESPDVSR